MMSMLSTMVTCRWSARRIQRYLDADPAGRLEPAEIRRLETHLATCRKCAAAAEQYDGIRGALASWASQRDPDPTAVARLQLAAERLMLEDVG